MQADPAEAVPAAAGAQEERDQKEMSA
jgi:hypothetical protein